MGSFLCWWGRREEIQGESMSVLAHTFTLESEKWASWPTSQLEGQKTVVLLCFSFSPPWFLFPCTFGYECQWKPEHQENSCSHGISKPAKQGKIGLHPAFLFSLCSLPPSSPPGFVDLVCLTNLLAPNFWSIAMFPLYFGEILYIDSWYTFQWLLLGHLSRNLNYWSFQICNQLGRTDWMSFKMIWLPYLEMHSQPFWSECILITEYFLVFLITSCLPFGDLKSCCQSGQM